MVLQRLTGWFELERGDGSNIRCMEGMRGLAVSLVFLVHYCTLGMPYVENSGIVSAVDVVHAIGNFGVDLFFVMSGYLIYQSAIRGATTYRVFIARRIRRIYPTFFAMFVIYLLLSVVVPHESKIPSGALEAVLYIVANALLLPGIFPIDPMITVAWSLSYEVLYYVTLPLAVRLFSLDRMDPRQRSMLYVVFTIAGLLTAAVIGGPARALMFVAGILLYELKDRCAWKPGSTIAWLALCSAAVAMVLPLTGNAGAALRAGLLFVALFVFCLACFRSPNASATRALCLTPLRWLGNMSYSYYLMHGLVLKAFFLIAARLWDPTGDDVACFLILLVPGFVATLVASAVLYLGIERPVSLKPASGRTAASAAG